MKSNIPISLLLGALCLGVCACGKQAADPVEQIAPAKPAQAATQLDQAFTAAPTEIQEVAKAAADALQRADYESAVQSLQMIREQGSLTVDQGLAVHNSMISLEARLIAAMGAGDPNAKRAYDQLKKARKN